MYVHMVHHWIQLYTVVSNEHVVPVSWSIPCTDLGNAASSMLLENTSNDLIFLKNCVVAVSVSFTVVLECVRQGGPSPV